MNFPKYRAKRLDNGEYTVGFYSFLDNEHGITSLNGYYVEIDPKTLSINFPDVEDKNGTPIFASLSNDGVGGDIAEAVFGESSTLYSYDSWEGYIFINKGSVSLNGEWCVNIGDLGDTTFEVTSIHEGEE